MILLHLLLVHLHDEINSRVSFSTTSGTAPISHALFQFTVKFWVIENELPRNGGALLHHRTVQRMLRYATVFSWTFHFLVRRMQPHFEAAEIQSGVACNRVMPMTFSRNEDVQSITWIYIFFRHLASSSTSSFMCCSAEIERQKCNMYIIHN